MGVLIAAIVSSEIINIGESNDLIETGVVGSLLLIDVIASSYPSIPLCNIKCIIIYKYLCVLLKKLILTVGIYLTQFPTIFKKNLS